MHTESFICQCLFLLSALTSAGGEQSTFSLLIVWTSFSCLRTQTMNCSRTPAASLYVVNVWTQGWKNVDQSCGLIVFSENNVMQRKCWKTADVDSLKVFLAWKQGCKQRSREHPVLFLLNNNLQNQELWVFNMTSSCFHADRFTLACDLEETGEVPADDQLVWCINHPFTDLK